MAFGRHVIPIIVRSYYSASASKRETAEGPASRLQKTTMMILAVTLHNIPEGMAVGVVYAGYLWGILKLQLPEQWHCLLELQFKIFQKCNYFFTASCRGHEKIKSICWCVLSGIVEPIGCSFTILMANQIVPALPYLLSFAAGAMLYVVVEELIPEMSEGKHSNIGTLFFAVGFSVMMILDVALG